MPDPLSIKKNTDTGVTEAKTLARIATAVETCVRQVKTLCVVLKFGKLNAIRPAIVLFVLVLASTTVIAPVSGALGTSPRISENSHVPEVAVASIGDEPCQPPLALRERAKTLRSELVALDASVVSRDTLSNVDSRLQRGQSNFNLDRYCDAKEAYESAIAIAEPALSRAYLKATHQELDEIDDMLAAEEADGNPDPNVGELREHSTRIREDLRGAESLQARRDLYERAEQLKTDTRSKLPTTLGEQAIEAVLESRFVAGLAVLLALVVAAETYLLYDAYREKGNSPNITSRGD